MLVALVSHQQIASKLVLQPKNLKVFLPRKTKRSGKMKKQFECFQPGSRKMILRNLPEETCQLVQGEIPC